MESLAFLTQLGDNPFEVVLTFMRNGGVLIFVVMMIIAARFGWISYIQGQYFSKKNFVLLAIDIPRVNEQSMKAVEQIIATLHGVFQGPNFKERNWDGVVEDSFSLEIVSIDGYIQYFVRCDDYNVDIVKGAFFAQYPDAEIIEVEDYTQNAPEKFPDEKFDLWGTELVLQNKGCYPIRTYEHFEHSLTQIFADPMASILEVLSRLRPGEQVWLQLVITPLGGDWRDSGLKEVDALAGKPTKSGPRFGALGEVSSDFIDEFRNQVFAVGSDGSSDEGGADADFNRLTSGERLVIEETQKKLSRLAFETKFRMVYIAPKEVMHALRVIGSVYGAIKQYNTLDMNGFVPGRTKTSKPTYYSVKKRQLRKKNAILRAYRDRDNWVGDNGYPMSTTELATIFHFPVDTVRAPLVARTVSKKSEPPTGLPLEFGSPFEAMKSGDKPEPPATDDGEPGPNLPIDDTMSPEGDEPAALEIPAAPERVAPAAAEPAPDSYPLHSMPGLPPGVRPVDPHAHVADAPAQPRPQQPVNPQPQMQQTAQPQQQMPAHNANQPQTVHQQTHPAVPPDHFAPQQQLQQQMPVQQAPVQPQQPYQQQPQQPPVQAPRSEPGQQAPTRKSGPPTNLPIG